MPVRERYRNAAPVIGTYEFILGGAVIESGQSSYLPFAEETTDIAGEGYGSPYFYSDKIEAKLTGLTGAYGSGNREIRRVFNGFTDTYTGNASIQHLPTNIKSVSGADLMARMNPNKPYVDYLTFAAELYDLPKLASNIDDIARFTKNVPHYLAAAGASIIRSAKGNLSDTLHIASYGSGLNLAWQFGWAPLLSDLDKIVGLGARLDKRLKQLKALSTDRGLTRSVSIDSASASDFKKVTLHSGPTIDGTVTTVTKVDRWASSRWKSASPPDFRPTEWDAFRSLIGGTPSPATLWNILPWSWLIDYFTDIGSYLEGHRNTVPATMTEICVMTKSVTYVNYQVIRRTVPAVNGGGGRRVRTSLHRMVPPVVPFPTSVPFLGQGEVDILSSLALTKRSAWKRWSR